MCGRVGIERERERKRKRKKKGGDGKRSVCFLKERERFKEKGGLRLEGRKERRKRGTRGTRGQVDMDEWIRVDGHMGEHFRGTGGR
jgi:hypothetical protein